MSHAPQARTLCSSLFLFVVISYNPNFFIHTDEFDHPEAFRNYTGLFNVRKLARLASLAQHQPETLSYGFMRKKKKLYIEKLHLPPETSRSTSSAAAGGAPEMMCAPRIAKNPLDF